MKSFKLSTYNHLNRGITSVLADVNNAVNVSKPLAGYLDATSIDVLNAADVLQRQRQDKAKALPGHGNFVKAGIDLSQNVPECTVSASQLNVIESVASQYKNGQYAGVGRYISYSQKAGEFVVNPVGQAALDAAIIRLEGADEKTLDMVTTLHDHLVKHNPALLWKLVQSEGIRNAMTYQLNLESLITLIHSNKPAK